METPCEGRRDLLCDDCPVVLASEALRKLDDEPIGGMARGSLQANAAGTTRLAREQLHAYENGNYRTRACDGPHRTGLLRFMIWQDMVCSGIEPTINPAVSEL